jgi:pimeloyl-ACP methyl ester carboxylesterase
MASRRFSAAGCLRTRYTLRYVLNPEAYFPCRDGVRLAYREVGEGRPLVLLPGLDVGATLWLQHGQADRIAAHGYRVIMPDLRGLGSAKPRDAAAYPLDVLTDDGLALVDHLGLDHYDLGGYSLGGRIVVRMLVRGATPGRAVVAGQGLRQVLGAEGGAGSFMRRILAGLGTFEPGSSEEQAEQWLRANGADPVALLHVLNSIVATPVEAVGQIQVPTLVVMGADDERAVSVDQLVAALPRGNRAVVPGDHGTAASSPELATAIVDFLAGR